MRDGLRGQQNKEASNEDPAVVLWRKSPMRRVMLAAISVLAGLSSLGFWLLGQPAIAQDAAQAVYIVTYVEVAPNAAAEGRKLFLGYVNDARKASGAVQIDAVQ